MQCYPHLLIKDAHHWETNHRQNTNVEYGVIATVGDLTVELLIVCAKVHLLHSKHEYSSHEDKGTIVHLLNDNI